MDSYREAEYPYWFLFPRGPWKLLRYDFWRGLRYMGLMFFPSFVALVVHKKPSYVECTRYSCNISLIYVQVLQMARNTIWPWFPMLHQAPPHPRWTNLLLIWLMCLQPCMRTGWVLETSPSDHYWRRYEVGQWLCFEWFWGWGTSNARLARRKLGK